MILQNFAPFLHLFASFIVAKNCDISRKSIRKFLHFSRKVLFAENPICAIVHSLRQCCNLRTVNLKVLFNLLKCKWLQLTRENSLMIAINTFVFYNVEVKILLIYNKSLFIWKMFLCPLNIFLYKICRCCIFGLKHKQRLIYVSQIQGLNLYMSGLILNC